MPLACVSEITVQVRDPFVTGRKIREEIAWWLAVLAAGLLCLALLPFCPLCWVLGKLDGMHRE